VLNHVPSFLLECLKRVYSEVYNLTRTDLHDQKRSYGTLQNAGKFIWSSIFCSDASDSQLRSRLPPEEGRVRPSGSSLISLEPNFERTYYCRSSPYFVSRIRITAEACKGLSVRHCIIPHHLLMAMQTTMCKPAFLLSSPFNMMVIDTPQLMELHCRWTSPRSCKRAMLLLVRGSQRCNFKRKRVKVLAFPICRFEKGRATL
jgi:hypothetical protein